MLQTVSLSLSLSVNVIVRWPTQNGLRNVQTGRQRNAQRQLPAIFKRLGEHQPGIWNPSLESGTPACNLDTLTVYSAVQETCRRDSQVPLGWLLNPTSSTIEHATILFVYVTLCDLYHFVPVRFNG